MTTIMIDLNIDKKSKTCDGCHEFGRNHIGICNYFNVYTGNIRSNDCIQAQNRAEDFMSNGC